MMVERQARTLCEVARSHRQNHAMLLMLLRSVDLPVELVEVERIDRELVIIDELVQAIGRDLHQHAIAQHGDRHDRRSGERRIGERRWDR
jgi:hypothetical protein